MSFGKVPIFASYCRRGADSGNYRAIKPPPTSGGHRASRYLTFLSVHHLRSSRPFVSLSEHDPSTIGCSKRETNPRTKRKKGGKKRSYLMISFKLSRSSLSQFLVTIARDRTYGRTVVRTSSRKAKASTLSSESRIERGLSLPERTALISR